MSWILTASNRQIDFLNPDPNQITIEDIATGLSNIPRFAGQLDRWYSVAEHCLVMDRIFTQHTTYTNPSALVQISKAILIHDATEAYMCDVPTPLKNLLPDYNMIESRLDERIKYKFHVATVFDSVVHTYDLIMLKNEALSRNIKTNWLSDDKYKNIPIIPNFLLSYLDPKTARDMFLKRWSEV